MTEVTQEMLEAKDYFRKADNEAFEAAREYNKLQAKTNELREEWLGLCEVLRLRDRPYVHLTGLIMLERRMHSAYRDVRIAALRMLRRRDELTAEASRAWREYMRLRKSLKDKKEEESCAGV